MHKNSKKVSSSSSSSNAEFCQASNFATILPSPLYFSPNSNIFTPPSLPFAFCKKKIEGEGEGEEEQQMLRFRNVHLDICSERRRIFSESKGFFSSFVFFSRRICVKPGVYISALYHCHPLHYRRLQLQTWLGRYPPRQVNYFLIYCRQIIVLVTLS